LAQISRKELKSDEFVSGMDAAFEFFLQHQTRIIAAAIVVAVVAGIGYGIFAWQRHRNQTAAAMLAQALNTLHAPLASAGAPPTVTSYPTVQARAVVAAQQFQAVVNAYPSTDTGKLARYYLGLAQLDLNQNSAAESNLEAASRSSDTVVALTAQNALANLDIQLGKLPQAHALLITLSRQDSPTLPKAVAMLELADLDREYNPTEAAQYYRQLETEYPSTPTAQQASQQLASLKQ
jgi:TolA-binding protein